MFLTTEHLVTDRTTQRVFTLGVRDGKLLTISEMVSERGSVGWKRIPRNPKDTAALGWWWQWEHEVQMGRVG